MGSLIGVESVRKTLSKKPQKSKGDRLGWKPIGTSSRKPLSELSSTGGRVSGNYCLMSCAKLIP
jgi:hypothetical protein